MIRSILFDLGRVLVPFDFTRAYERVEALGGLKANEVSAALQPSGILQRFESGQIEPEAFIREASAICGIQVSETDFLDLWNCIFSRETLVPESLVESLATRYRMVLLSNTNPLHYTMLRREYPILRHFHEYVLSYEVGAMKPADEIYRRAVQAAGCLPEECFFTDDMEHFVAGARAHGIDAVQFTSAEQLEHELRKRGIERA